MSPGRQTKPLDCARPDWMESRLGATSRMRPASSGEKANKREEADLSGIGGLLLPRNMPLDEGHAYLARWSGGVSIHASPTLCSAPGPAYMDGRREDRRFGLIRLALVFALALI